MRRAERLGVGVHVAARRGLDLHEVGGDLRPAGALQVAEQVLAGRGEEIADVRGYSLAGRENPIIPEEAWG